MTSKLETLAAQTFRSILSLGPTTNSIDPSDKVVQQVAHG